MGLKLMSGNMLRNKRRVLVTVLCMMFSVILICSIVNIFVSFQNMRRLHDFKAYGRYNVMLFNISSSDMLRVKDSLQDEVELGIEKYLGKTEEGIYVFDSDDIAQEMNNYNMVIGGFPENDGEIAISATARINDEYVYGSYSPGDFISVGGTLYTLVGIIDNFDYSSINYAFALTKTNNNDTRYNLYLYTDNNEQYEAGLGKIHDILGEDIDVSNTDKFNGMELDATVIQNLNLNTLILKGEGTTADKNIGTLLIAILVIVCISSVIMDVYVFTAYYRGRDAQQKILVRLGIPNYKIIINYMAEGLLLVFFSALAGGIISIPIVHIVFKHIQSLRTNKLEDFSPVFTSASIFIAVMIAFSTILFGLIISLVRNNIIANRVKRNHAGRKSMIRIRPAKRKQMIFRFFHRENHFFTEKLLSMISIVLVGCIFFLFLAAGEYMRVLTDKEDKFSYQFIITCNRMDELPDIKKSVDHIELFDAEYTVTALVSYDETTIYEPYREILRNDYNSVGNDTIMGVEIDGVSENTYYKWTELSDTISYEEFVQSGKAILKDGVYDSDGNVVFLLPEDIGSISYQGRDDVLVSFPSGELEILGHSRNRAGEDRENEVQVNVVLPAEVFRKYFEPSMILIYINAEEGYESETAARLGALSEMYHFNLVDQVSGYIAARDNERTVKGCLLWILLIVTILNLILLIYMNELRFLRMKSDLSVLGRLGCPGDKMIWPIVLELLVKTIVAGILSSFISIFVIKRFTTEAAYTVLDGKLQFILFMFAALMLVQIISVIKYSICSISAVGRRNSK